MSSIDPLGFLGREFVAYVAAVAEGEVDDALSDPQHRAHDQVRDAVARCRDFLAANPIGIHEAIARTPSDSGISSGNSLREIGGHDPPNAEAMDDLAQPLADIARDVFPALLLPPAQQSFFPDGAPQPSHRLLTSVILDHPSSADFLRRLRSDQLHTLFEVEPSPPFFSFPSGGGNAMETASLSLGLLGAACVRARLLEPTFTLTALVAQLDTLVQDLRRIQQGREVGIPVAVALQGFNIQPGSRFDLPWGSLRAVASDTLKAVGDAFLPRRALFVTEVCGPVTVGSAVGDNGPPMPPSSRLRAFETALDSAVQKTTLSLLLLDVTPRVAAVRTRAVAVTPFFGIGWGANGYGPEPVPGPQGTLTPEHVTDLRNAADLVDRRYTPELDIPTRRLVSALSARHDIEDGLVDAVVAWESLFAGTDAGELNFRIAAAMAWLLGASPEDRLAVHRELSALYGLRSRILHRGRAGRGVVGERDQAVDFGVRALKALLIEHPDLVSDENRGKKLIMRGEGPVVA